MIFKIVFLKIAVQFVLALGTAFCISTAINADAKNHNIQNREIWTGIGFLFGIIAGVVYLICRKKLISKSPEAPEQDVSKKSRIKITVCIIMAIVFTVGGRAFSVYCDTIDASDSIFGAFLSDNKSFNHISYNPENNAKFDYFYDMNKERYIDTLKVPYYTENGDKYIFEMRDGVEGLTNVKSNEFHKSEECFVNIDGYLIFDDSLYSVMSNYDYCAEKDGKLYYMAAYVSWDNFGNPVDNHGLFLNID